MKPWKYEMIIRKPRSVASISTKNEALQATSVYFNIPAEIADKALIEGTFLFFCSLALYNPLIFGYKVRKYTS